MTLIGFAPAHLPACFPLAPQDQNGHAHLWIPLLQIIMHDGIERSRKSMNVQLIVTRSAVKLGSFAKHRLCFGRHFAKLPVPRSPQRFRADKLPHDEIMPHEIQSEILQKVKPPAAARRTNDDYS